MVQVPEVVITGVGLASPIGIGKKEFSASLREGRSGVRPITLFETRNLPVRFGAEVRDFQAKQYVKPRKSLKVMGREIQLAFAAASLAIEDADLERAAVNPERLGAVFGTEMMCSEFADLEDVYRSCIVDGEFCFDLWGNRAMSHIFPLWMLKYLPNMAACHIGIAHDARGPNNSIAQGEVSSLLAISEGVSIIQRGQADAMIVGGTGSRANLPDMLWRGDEHLSHRSEDPAAASRPFDAARDGTVNGEGAGAFVIENQAHAQARGAAVFARVLGFSSRFEPTLNGRPTRGSAIRDAVEQALRASGLEAADVGHVNAHGLSTIEEDVIEAGAIRQALGDVPVTAPKSFFGNLGAGGGAVETAASVASFAEGKVPVTLNYEQPDPQCPVNVVHGEPLETDRQIAVLLNQSRTGQAAAVVLAGP